MHDAGIQTALKSIHIRMKRFLLILARAMDYRIGITDDDKPDLPILPMDEAWFAFLVRLLIVAVNFITCGFVIASVIRHW